MGGLSLRRRVMALCVAVVAFSPLPAAVAVSAPVTALVGTPGHCPDANGVTVVVDYQELGGTTEVRCAPGPQATGLAALENAGFAVTGTQRWGKAFVCRINGLPTSATEPCVTTPPATAYWSYWHAPNGGAWTYSQQGASGRQPPLGSFEGWSFSLNHGPNDNPPPDVAPVRP
ncbi:flagellar hook-length control protein FliK [Umezawaea endophytica]|uniref:Flagellar hook-length control protein FliK n=1 Tax=Umezawaea endophytica TaxID=1654476 RepID=A0A9X2VFA4_9PSEU|nr:flagellar hook-length control protein FliK [Umezawaea endophytica]MCS7475460.1 flagellar hook-length control protein FliK [Umezawaea endophytica]